MAFTDTDEYEAFLSKIRTGECALILGPLFAITNDGKKVNELLKEALVKDHNVDLDTDYDNIFIARSDRPLIKSYKHKQIISKFYQGIQRDIHQMYQQIAQLNFNTILSFTQDDFLYNAFKETGTHCVFQYYRGQHSGEKNGANMPGDRNAAALDAQVPLLYNLYGCHTNQESLIIDYTSFYEFFFVFIGDQQQSQLAELKMRLTKCTLFFFIGFDLKKWYVPIMLTKLLNAGKGRERNPMTITLLDDTADRENPNYMQWLQKYPMEMSPIPDVTAVQLIAEVFRTAEKERQDAGNQPVGTPLIRERKQKMAPSLSLNDAYNKVKKDPNADALIETCEGLSRTLREGNDNMNASKLDLLQGSLAQLKDQAGFITEEESDIKMRNIRKDILDIINNKLGTVQQG